ncbi:MAG: putative lipid II flippase FtsW [Gammaproteobacteria bacterium]|nr:putative lipid II flippase FtsW [Gammaproteobacteria bacterium]
MNRWSQFWQVQDYWFLTSVLFLVVLGFLMVFSASSDYASYRYDDLYYFSKRHAVYLLLGVIAMTITALIPLKAWFELAFPLFLVGIVLLIAVLIVGTNVNGSQRWIRLAGFSLQPSEFMKVAMVLAVARYVTRFQENLTQRGFYFIRPLIAIPVVAILLLLEPDYGATVLISATVVGVLFLAGVPLLPFMSVMGLALTAAYFVAISSPYRLARLTGFADPWANQFDSGYQLTQSLIAFGRGHFDGVGYGNSVQKLMFLPEAHTDFVFSIWAEETGWLGALLIVALFTILVARLFVLCRRALNRNQRFIAWVAAGFGFLIAGQAFINLGVASGLLPTKGLTLPFISYGGSSLLVSFALVGIVMRMHVAVNQMTTKRGPKASNDSLLGVIP